ncbi:MAG: bifunctional phosphopantothenoylcysteine decarboxylase/phosphopantothenate--cysteine ligase CoaBC [Candidatus Velthaea sp.]
MNGRRVLLGVCGGIAAYKAAALASRLVQNGALLDVVMTAEAQRFVGPLTFAALARRPAYTSLWEQQDRIPHITLARDNEAIAIVPATANVLAKLAHGIADDLLTNVVLAARVPVIIAPAMNTAMLEAAPTQINLAALRARGMEIIDPGSGFLAEREFGVGRLADEDAIVAALERALARTRDLAADRVLITAGPTREAIDPVRFLSNASTGTMGIELAREAVARGAKVDLVLGPTLVTPPAGANVARVTSAQEMHDAALARARNATIAIATAAVADWRPAQSHPHKVKKSAEPQSIALERTPDILAALGERKNGTFLVGFAAETRDAEAYGREKLQRKRLDAIAVNDVSGERGFGTGDNALTVLWGADGRRELGTASKRELAMRLWDALLELRVKRG